MIKTISPNLDSVDVATAALVKISQHGLRNHDRSLFIKRASAGLLDAVDSYTLHSGEHLVHMLAIGATESFGPNRNGDGFKIATCRQYHPTFVKHAMFYRDHENRDPKKSYGRIVASDFNEDMSRIELLAALNGTKQAAERNGGLIADKELAKLESGEPLAVSMACHIDNDVCSYCKNAARRRHDYCRDVREGGSCRAGGLFHKMGSVVTVDGDVHHLHADNPRPRFFDISHVGRPADRIAYSSGLLKSAAARNFVGGNSQAEFHGVTAPLPLLTHELTTDTLPYGKKADALRLIEQRVHADEIDTRYCAAMPATVVACDLPPDAYVKRGGFNEFLGVLRDHNLILPLNAFIQLTTDSDPTASQRIAKQASAALPGIYTRMLAGDLSVFNDAVAYRPVPSTRSSFVKWAQANRTVLSLDHTAVQRRLMVAGMAKNVPAISPLPRLKEAAACDSPIEQLAEQYALYKLAFLVSQPINDEVLLTDIFAILQNYV